VEHTTDTTTLLPHIISGHFFLLATPGAEKDGEQNYSEFRNLTVVKKNVKKQTT
jgi:hypothetical protein